MKNNVKSKKKVLVVDDDVIVADTLVMVLSVSGFDARAAYSGQAALEAVGSYNPDILLSDVMMPGMSGIEAAVAILKKCPTCKVLLMSGQAAMIDLMQTREDVARFEILAKPIEPRMLLRRLQTYAFQGSEAS